jgi:hypothetical protein
MGKQMFDHINEIQKEKKNEKQTKRHCRKSDSASINGEHDGRGEKERDRAEASTDLNYPIRSFLCYLQCLSSQTR